MIENRSVILSWPKISTHTVFFCQSKKQKNLTKIYLGNGILELFSDAFLLKIGSDVLWTGIPLFEYEPGESNFWLDDNGEAILDEIRLEAVNFGDGDLPWKEVWGRDVFFNGTKDDWFDKVSPRLLVATSCAVDILSLGVPCSTPLKFARAVFPSLFGMGLVILGIPVAKLWPLLPCRETGAEMFS